MFQKEFYHIAAVRVSWVFTGANVNGCGIDLTGIIDVKLVEGVSYIAMGADDIWARFDVLLEVLLYCINAGFTVMDN